jgi:hypothetical protein
MLACTNLATLGMSLHLVYENLIYLAKMDAQVKENVLKSCSAANIGCSRDSCNTNVMLFKENDFA